MSKKIYGYGRQTITDADIAEVLRVLSTDYLTQGPETPAFEQALVDYCGQGQSLTNLQAVVVNSGTSALQLIYQALGIGKESLVWVPAISFSATANCAVALGSNIAFIDCEADTGLIDLDALEANLQQANTDNQLPDLVVPVHLNGRPVDMKRLAKLSAHYGFQVVEDACHALGSVLDGEYIGSCAYSAAAAFSFHPVKSITTGEGGAILSRDANLINKVRSGRSHGFQRIGTYPWENYQETLSFNARLSDIGAALGHSQLSKLNERIDKRHKLAQLYDQAIANIKEITTLPALPDGMQSAHHLYPVRLTHHIDRKEQLLKHLCDDGVMVQIHYPPIYSHPFYQKMRTDWVSCVGAEAYSNAVFSLPLYPTLTDQEVSDITERLSNALCVLERNA